MLTRTLRFLTLTGPLMGIGAWGGFYLYDCGQALFAPGTGIEFDLATPGGNLQVKCDRYSFDPLIGAAVADEVRINDPKGKLLARIGKAYFRGIRFDGTIAPSVVIRNGYIALRRDTKGDFDLKNYFPKSTGEKSDIPYEVELQNCRIALLDDTSSPSTRNQLTIGSAKLAGQADNLIGTAKVSLDQLASSDIEFQKTENGFSLIGKNITADLVAIRNRLANGQEKKFLDFLKPLQAKSLGIKGDLKFALPTKGNPSWTANISAESTELAWEKLPIGNPTFKGTLNQDGMSGMVSTNFPHTNGITKATMNASMSFGKDLQFMGILNAENITRETLKSFNFTVPQEVQFNQVSADSLIIFDRSGFRIRGGIKHSNLVAFDQKIETNNLNFIYDQNKLALQIPELRSGKSQGIALFELDLTTGNYVVSGSLNRVRGQDFSKWVPKPMLGTTANLKFTTTGNTKSQNSAQPTIHIRGNVTPSWQTGDQLLKLPTGELSVRYEKGKATVERFDVTSKEATLAVTGWLEPNKSCSLSIFGSGIELSKLNSDARGSVDVRLKISGALAKPRIEGKLAGFDIGYKGLDGDISAITATVASEGTQLGIKNLLAFRGAGQLRGEVTYDWEKDTLDGQAEAKSLTVDDFVQGPISGGVDVPTISIKGTLSKPKVTGNFTSRSLVAQGLTGSQTDAIETEQPFQYAFNPKNISGEFEYEDNKLKVSNGKADIVGGRLSDITVSLNLEENLIVAEGGFTKLALHDLLESIRKVEPNLSQSTQPTTLDEFVLTGNTSGKWNLTITDGKFQELNTNGKVDDIHLNKAFFGSGDWDLSYKNESWTANAFIGSLNDYLRINEFTFVPETGKLNGELITFNLPVKELISAVEPQFKNNRDAYTKIELFTGKLGLLATLSGQIDAPQVELNDFQLNELKLGEEALGTLSLKAKLANNNLEISEGQLLGPKIRQLRLPNGAKVNLNAQQQFPDGLVKFRAKSQDMKTIDAEIDAFGFHVSNFAALYDPLKKVDFDIRKAHIVANGSLAEPSIRADLEGKAFADEVSASNPLFAKPLLVKGKLASDPTGTGFKVKFNSDYEFSTLKGKLDTDFELDSKWALNAKAPFSASIELDGERSLVPFYEQVNGIETGKSGGSVRGGFQVKNTLENPLITGGLQVKVDGIRSTSIVPIIGRPLDIALRDIQVNLGIDNNPSGLAVKLNGFAASAQSQYVADNRTKGYAKFEITKPIQKLLNGEQTPEQWMKEANLNGLLSMDSVYLAQIFPENTFAQAELGTPTKRPIKIGGSLVSPDITGDIEVRDVKTLIPTLIPQTSEGTTPSFSPNLNLTFTLLNPAEIKTSALEVWIKGNTTIKGSLSAINADGTFLLDRGSLALPGAKVKLVPDGQMKLSYRGDSFEPKAELIANLKGETALTTLKNGTTPERYEITLAINGDLLDPNGVNLTATSIPGDLPQDRILGLLGRTDLLESVLKPGANVNLEADIKNAVTAFALPNLLGGVSNSVARGLGLEYVAFDYNAFEQLSLSFAKSIGNGFFIQGRRQVSTPLPGFIQGYDLRLAYRPRGGPKAIRNLSFSIGTDQYLAYKLAIDFSIRVRDQKGTYREIKLDVPK